MVDPLEDSRWTPEAAAHLLNRAAFGGSPTEIAELHRSGLRGAVDALLKVGEESDLFPPPEASVARDLEALGDSQKGKSEDERREIQRAAQVANRREVSELRLWWLNRMRWSPFAAREKATLFWHGHWATSAEKVKEAFPLWQQNETLRAHALGSFRRLALEMSRDTAMIRYLDLNQSKSGKPNENFARELMELFVLGEGNYTEQDIREAARAFTGYRVSQKTQQFYFSKRNFDSGEKTFFGKSGPFGGDEIVGILLENPQAPRFLARKLWVFYAGTEPTPAQVESLAAAYRASDYDTSAVLRRMFLSREFYSPEVVRRQVKSPVQWLVGTCKVLEIPLPNGETCEGMLRQLGQTLFAPPNVKGWDGGRAWITSSTLLLRYNFAGYLVSGKAGQLPGLPGRNQATDLPLARIFGDGEHAGALCDAAGWRLFQAPLSPALRERFAGFLEGKTRDPATCRDLLHAMMSTPEYQVT